MPMKTKQARESGKRIAERVHAGEIESAYALLAPVLAERTPFRLLGLIGEAIGAGPSEPVDAFLNRIASERTEGGWVVIGCALGQQLGHAPASAFARCREFIAAADIWYGSDILGERVPGPALLVNFQPALTLLAPWREDENAWVRRAVGVAAHFWAKRTRGARSVEAENLLAFLEPMFEEREMDVVKGVGWGLKTLGRYYPALMADWLPRQIERPHRALMLRKARTYLADEFQTPR